MAYVTVNEVVLVKEQDKVFEHLQRFNQSAFEPESFAAWREAAVPGTVVVDVGAYTGVYAIAAAKQDASVVALEPNPQIYDRLEANAAINRVSISILNVAAGHQMGRGKLSECQPMTSSGSLEKQDVPTIQVRVITLDSLGLYTVAALKIDVEGWELQVLLGARRILLRNRPLVIAEALTEEKREELTQFMSGQGYAGQVADDRNIIFRYVRPR